MYSSFMQPYGEPIVQKALLEVIRNIRPMINELNGMQETGILHELSCFISDPGSPNQVMSLY